MAEKKPLTHLERVQRVADYNFKTRKADAEREAAFKQSLNDGSAFDPEADTTTTDEKKGTK